MIKPDRPALSYGCGPRGEMDKPETTSSAVVDQAGVFETVVELIDDLIVILDDNECVSYMNAAADRAFGHPARSMHGAPVDALFPGFVVAGFQEGARTADGIAHEIDAQRADGSLFRVTVRVERVVLEKASGHAVAVVAREADRSDQELRESEQRLKSVIDNTTAVIYIKDVEGRYLLINRRFEELFSLVDANVRGKTDHDVFPQAIADSFRNNDLAVVEAGTPLDFDEVALHDDGRHTYISTKFPLLRASGEVYAVCGISTDITTRKRVESELTSTKTHLQRLVDERTADLSDANRRLEAEASVREDVVDQLTRLFETANEGIWTIDAETKTTFVNPTMAGMLGYTVEEMQGRSVYDFMREELRAGAAPHIADRLQNVAEQLDIELCRKDGSPLWAIMATNPIRDKTGNVVGALAMITDITSRKRAEESRQLLLLELDHRVKNVLATVIGLADLTAKTARSITDYREAMAGRLQVLARTHEALARASWLELPLDEIVSLVLEPHKQASQGRVRTRGDSEPVAARASTPLALTLNELGTNALKYGALSCAQGCVDVSWRRSPEGMFELTWQESAGPPVSSPTHRGTGLDLISRLIEFELDGTVDLAFASSGLTCRLSIPSLT